jgi:choice-of-anchor A domain-containing protein/pilin isopeptide linkage protein
MREMKNKWKGLLSKEIPLSALKKTLALFLAVLMVVTSSDFSGLYGMGEVKAEGERNDISITGSSTADGTNKLTMSVSSNTKDSQLSAYNVLGDAWNYGITAEEYSHEVGGDSETNFAVKTIDKFPSQSGITGKAYFSRICDSYIGEIADGCIVKIKGIPNVSTIHRIFTPCSKDKFDADGGSQFVWVMTDPETEKSEFKHDKGVTVEIHPTSKDKVDSYVDGLISKVSTEGNTLLGKDSVADYSKLPSFTQNSYKLKLDLTNAPDGTYYFNLDKYKALYEALSSQAGGLSINKNPGQTVVFNSSRQTDSDHPITIQKFNINDIGTDTIADSDQTNNCMEYASSIIFNFPNAGNVNLNAFAGIVLAPNAIVTNDSGASAGWLVAKKVVAKAEWHFLNSKLTTEAAPPVQFKAIKTIDNNDIGDKTPKFSFKLEERGVDGSFKQIQTVNNNGSAINFNQIKYTGKDDGTHIYRITEVAGDNSQYTYDTSTYYVKVDVSTKVVGNVEKSSPNLCVNCLQV